MRSNEILQEIKNLTFKYKQTKLSEILGLENVEIPHVQYCNIESNESRWKLEYTFVCDSYHADDYEYKTKSTRENAIYKTVNMRIEICVETENIQVYRSDIKDNNENFIKVYTKNNKYMIYNPHYDLELTTLQQIELINQYQNNIRIPEWLCISVIKSINGYNHISKFINEFRIG